MTFLAPLAGLIGAFLTVPPLLFFYLLKLRRRPLTVSSTMLWEQAVHDVQVNVPFRWIRPSLLLLLHLLILALFLLALARPAIDGKGGAAREVIFLLDVSASMQARDAEGGLTRLEAAKARAIDVARPLFASSGRCSVTVVIFAQDAALAGPACGSLSQLRAMLNPIEPTDQPGRLEPALRLAEQLMTRATTETQTPSPPLVCLFSDGALMDQTPLSLAGARVSFEPVRVSADDAQGNIAIVSCSAARDEDNLARVRLFVRLQSTFASDQPIQLDILLDGEPIAQHALIVPRKDSFGPGTVGRTFAIDVPGSGVVRCAARVDDLLAADNSASVVLSAPIRARILLVHPERVEPDPFLTDALRELPVRSFRVISQEAYRRLAGSVRGQVDLIVFDRVMPEEVPPVSTISVGAPLVPEPENPGAESAGGFVLSWDRRSSIMRDVSLDTVQIDRWLGPAPRAPLEALGRVSDLALVRDGAVITLVRTPRTEHLLLRFEIAQTNWPLHFSFPIMLFNAVDVLTGAGASRTGQAFTTSEPIVVRVLEEGSVLKLTGPVDLSIPRPNPAPGTLSLGVLSRAGVYRGEGMEPPVLAVNLVHAQESLLEVRESVSVGGVEAVPIEQVSGPREIWSWLVAAAGVLLLIEWFIYAARVRV
ncbi:MAG: VWA domain-containing protein [Planctomycetota bacterium]|nr:MAG: VWA domain-containing protein [Planctomycetota bacterium]